MVSQAAEMENFSFVIIFRVLIPFPFDFFKSSKEMALLISVSSSRN